MQKITSRFARTSILIVGAWLTLFVLAPQLMLFIATFLQRGQQEFITSTFTLENYARLLDPVFLFIFWESFRLAGVTTLACLLLGYPFAYILATSRKNLRPWLLLLVIIPFWTNSLIRTYAMIIILKSGGVLSNLLQALGLIDKPISLMYTDIAIFIGFTYTLLPFMILPLYAAIEKLDMRLLDASKDLGATAFQTFRHITLPLTMPGIVAGCMLVFLPALGMFYVPEILGGSRYMLLGNYITNQFLVARDWPLGAAASTILTITLIIMIALYLRSVRASSRTGGDNLEEELLNTAEGA
ncbi:spermidine/putrescine ABC transporter permease PotB [Desulfovibrio subterraneus]|jgi:spermidine/putrescine transport system permease protein|uniref:Spermidine/putrescine ABC transporter permease n=1 Tax=Desulfovibrio subterraneus TaxID=2718620 RepID=A0A7J0BFW5_9BACT|nr:spermidine/putrescine ABC transporter permease PotB [Desulfovibrio subterraneus]WBF68888.1 spermidine/putrescine ABC transporter permease PotB [Desulfovibrio subterraneus]GFM32091.1 spermidine/putrescine ABC transporter permease [Desulfovibrio subterraneus]